MIYKTLKKVSDVCQLLDKRRYSATKTVNGVTFTNNGDGTFTVNGTATAMIDYRGVSNNAKINVVVGHKYLMRGCPAGGSKNTYDMRLPFLGLDYGNGVIAKLTDSGDAYYVQIIVRAGIVCDNLVFKPQLFDLTEMYGAGNEPTTVEQFRQDFPEEMYDYKPYCFVKSYKTLLKVSDNKIITSYKKSLVCKTKNLFDISKLLAYTPETLPTNTAGVYNGTIIARAGVNSSVCESGKTLKELCPNLVAGETYTLSFETIAKSYVIYLRGANEYWHKNNSSVVTEAMLNSLVGFYANYPELTVATISNFQIELGDTATEYHPYGYL